QHRVRLAVELLKKEVEALARVALLAQGGAELRDVAAQARHLLRDVAAVGEVGDLLREPPLVEFDDLQTVARENLADALVDARAVALDLLARKRLDDGQVALDLVEARRHLRGE